jgi:predicted lipoprotein with Yx(FWY)xxD motif
MKTSTIIIWIIIIIVVVFGGWWLYTSSQPAATQSTSTTKPTPIPTLAIGSDPTLGEYLTASNGMTLYTLNKDSVGSSTCYGDCASEWPPYTVASAASLIAPTGATGTVATITRTDGTLQVTYNGMPLYLFAEDVNPGDTTGQNQNGFSVAHP